MTHRATKSFWQLYNALPVDVRRNADSAYELLKADPRHPSLHLKRVGRFWSSRVGMHYRVLAIQTESDDELVWFWIGTHAEYDRLISG